MVIRKAWYSFAPRNGTKTNFKWLMFAWTNPESQKNNLYLCNSFVKIINLMVFYIIHKLFRQFFLTHFKLYFLQSCNLWYYTFDIIYLNAVTKSANLKMVFIRNFYNSLKIGKLCWLLKLLIRTKVYFLLRNKYVLDVRNKFVFW